MISRDDIYASDFPVYFNGKMYKLDWLQSPRYTSNLPIDVGIDQSSACTGLTIQNIDKSMLMITELPRGDMSVNEYKQALTSQFDVLFSDMCIRHFIFEKHGRHITPLHSLINEVTDTIKTYTKPMIFDTDITVKGVLPSVWRSGFLISDDYTGQYRRDEVKWASVKEAIKRVPELECYIPYAHKKENGPDYDGFESYGIINGYLDLNYTSDGRRRINTTMEFRNGRKYEYTIFKTNELELNDFLLKTKKKYGGRDCPILLGNNKLLIDNMLNRVFDDYNEAVIVIPKDSPERPRLALEILQEHNIEDRYVIYTRAS